MQQHKVIGRTYLSIDLNKSTVTFPKQVGKFECGLGIGWYHIVIVNYVGGTIALYLYKK